MCVCVWREQRAMEIFTGSEHSLRYTYKLWPSPSPSVYCVQWSHDYSIFWRLTLAFGGQPISNANAYNSDVIGSIYRKIRLLCPSNIHSTGHECLYTLKIITQAYPVLMFGICRALVHMVTRLRTWTVSTLFYL